jgi:hypothetical protein
MIDLETTKAGRVPCNGRLMLRDCVNPAAATEVDL